MKGTMYPPKTTRILSWVKSCATTVAHVRDFHQKSSVEILQAGPAHIPRVLLEFAPRKALTIYLLGEFGKPLNVTVYHVTPARTSAAEERSTLLVGAMFETNKARRVIRNDHAVGGVGLLGAHDDFEL